MKKILGLAGMALLFCVCFVAFHVTEEPNNETPLSVDKAEPDAGLEVISEAERNENMAAAALIKIETVAACKAKGKNVDLEDAIGNATTPDKAYFGYYFVEEYSTALPAKYPDTGKNTFITTAQGIYKKDTGGVAPDKIENLNGWEKVSP